MENRDESGGTVVIRKPSSEWAKDYPVRIMDPDGWRIDGLDWETPITYEDFHNRAMQSTLVFKQPATRVPSDTERS